MSFPARLLLALPPLGPLLGPLLGAALGPALTGASVPSAAQEAGATLAEARELWVAGERRAALALGERLLSETPDDERLRALVVSWEMAVHRYAAALERMGPDDPARGLALSALGRCEEALEHLDPERVPHVETRVECLHRLGRTAEAAAAARAAVELLGEDDARVHFWRGREAAEAGRAEHAVPAFRAALERDPLHMAALFGLGRALVSLGEVDEGRHVLARHRELVPLVDAYEFALQGLDLDPTHAPNLAHVAGLEGELGLEARARSRFAEATERADPDELVPIALRHARFLEEAGAPDEAVAVLEDAGRAHDDVRLLVRAGDVLARQGRPVLARSRYEEALLLRPRDAAIRDRLEALAGGR